MGLDSMMVFEVDHSEGRMKKGKKKLTAAQRRARRERRLDSMTIFVKGMKKRVPRPRLIDGLTPDEFLARNTDPILMHQEGLWEMMNPEML